MKENGRMDFPFMEERRLLMRRFEEHEEFVFGHSSMKWLLDIQV